MILVPRRRTIEEARSLFTGPPDGCWHLPEGAGGPHGNGYFQITVSGRRWYAHRLAYTLLVGPIPDGLVLDHLCHTNDPSCVGGDSCMHRRCVNPAHLEPVTDATNALRGLGPTAMNARRETCLEGHPLVPQGKTSSRYCPKCSLARRIAKGETSGNGHWRDRTHCPQGHPYDEKNTYINRYPDGSPRCRMCRTCMRERADQRRRDAGIPTRPWRAGSNGVIRAETVAVQGELL